MIKMSNVRQKGVYLIPNLFTTGNLFSGFYAIISIFNAEYLMAAYAILAATVFDSLDGKAARFAHATSRFGTEYDSLADLVSFGLAPGLLIYSWALHSYTYNRLGWIAAFLFLACGALRLARFNVQSAVADARFFTGLPIPAAASAVALTVILDSHILRMGREIKPVLMLVMTYGLAFLMVSSIRYRSFKHINFSFKKPFQYLVSAILILVVIVLEPQIMLFSLVMLYALSGPVEKPVWALLALFGKKKEEVVEQDHDDIDDLDEDEGVPTHRYP